MPAHNAAMDPDVTGTSRLTARILDLVERTGNKLPDPITLFVAGSLAIMLASQVAVWSGWRVTKQVSVTSVEGGERSTKQGPATTKVDDKGTATITGTTITTVTEGTRKVTTVEQEVKPVSLLDRDGIYWVVTNLVKNFTGFAPLGIVLVAMMGIGVAEKTGAIGAALKVFVVKTPGALLTPAMVFIGINSSIALDAGYVVLPPIAAALYKSMGRSPMAGLAAVFAGVAAGFSANLLITGLDPLLAGFTQEAAQIIDPAVKVAPTCNYWFMIVSTFALTLAGWAVTAWLVEPRFANRPPELGGPSHITAEERVNEHLTVSEARGLRAALVAFLVSFAVVLAFVFIPGAPFHGGEGAFPRWVDAIVPIIFFVFVVPGIAYGIAAGKIASDKDVAKLMAQTMADMGPYIVLAFFAAQFIALFRQSNLGEMIALTGGEALASLNMSPWLLLVAFMLFVMFCDLFLSSASAKYAFMAPVFVPMFMIGANISPQLTQAAYRIADSVTNSISPLNAYMVILLVFLQKHMPKAAFGTLAALMLPYTIVFFIVWALLLGAWMALGIDLGPGGPLEYLPR